MSKANPTNHDLADIVDRGFRDVKSKLKAVDYRVEKVEGKVQEFHDFMIGENAVKNLSTNGGSVKISKEVLDIIKWLVLIIGTIVGAKGLIQ